MTQEQLKTRTRQFALDVVDVLMALRRDDFVEVVRPQLLRAGTGAATNYRAACRSRSDKEFASRLATVVEEVDEGELWLDFLQTRGYGAPSIIVRSEPKQSSCALSSANLARPPSASFANVAGPAVIGASEGQISKSLNPQISK